MAMMGPQEPFFCPAEDMMVYSTHRYCNTSLCSRKWKIKIYIQTKPHKENCVISDCAKQKKEEVIHQSMASEGETLAPW